MFHNFFISVRRSTCFSPFFHPSSGAPKTAHTASGTCQSLPPAASNRWQEWGGNNGLTNAWCCMCSFWAPDDGWINRLKHAEHLTEINELRNVSSCRLYCENVLVMHGHMNVESFLVLDGCFFHCNPGFHFTCTSCIISYQATQTAAIFNIFLLFFIYHYLKWGRLPSDSHNLSYSHVHWHSRAVSDFSQSTNHISQ